VTTELFYLTLAATLTGLMWLPYITKLLLTHPIQDAVGYPETPLTMAPWAERLKAAHYNSVENLVVFGTLVVVAHLAGISNGATESAALFFFWARLVHAISYAAAIPWVRTIAFLVAWGAMVCIAWQVLIAGSSA